MKSSLISSYSIVIAFLLLWFSSTQAQDIMCTMEYTPVCGEIQVQCIKAPCPPIQQTYGNTCMADAAGAKVVSRGECPDIIGGDNDEHGCKASAWYSRSEELSQCIRAWDTDTNLILRAYQKGLTKYNMLDTFMPKSYITRQQAAKMLVTLIEKSGIDQWIIKQPAGTCERKDVKSLDPTLAEAVIQSCTKGLFQWSSEGYFLPHQAVTREHMGFLFNRLSTFIPKLKEYNHMIDQWSLQPYTRLEFIQVLDQISQVLTRVASQNFSKQTEDLVRAQKLWNSKNITTYTIVQERSCFCPEEYRRPMRYNINNSLVQTGTVRYNDKDKEQLAPTIQTKLNSVSDAFAIIQDAIDDKVDSLEVTYDSISGYPTHIVIDYSVMMADEEQYLSFQLIK